MPHSCIEPLESRIAPATLIDPRTVTYKDVDGDAVTVKFSRDVFTGTPTAALALAVQVLTFNAGSVDATANANPAAQQLRLVDLTAFPVSTLTGSSANGLGFTITSTQQGSGDGLADVGAIKAGAVSVGTVVIDGDLGKIVSGGSALKIGVASLTVDSLGVRGTSTQIPSSSSPPDLTSTITGELTSLTVLHDIKDAFVKVIDGKTGDNVTTAANIGSLNVGGRIYSTASADDSGAVESGRAIGTVTVGNLLGGPGKNSGRISALQGALKSITITGDLSGGLGVGSGQVFAFGSIGTVSIGDDLIGGGEGSGVIRTFGSISSLTIGSDVISGTGIDSAKISALGVISKVLVKGNIDAKTTANSGARSATIYADAGLPNVTVQGSIFGGAGLQSGVIESGRTIGKLVVETNVAGGANDGSGSIVAHAGISSVTIKGDLTGGGGRQSGTVLCGVDSLLVGDLAAVAILGKVTGGVGVGSGAVVSGGKIKSATIGTLPVIKGVPLLSVLNGGQGNGSGSISALGAISKLKINGDVTGAVGIESGTVITSDRTKGFDEFAGHLVTATIAGRLIGGDGLRSGAVLVDGSLKTLTVGGILGGKGVSSGSVRIGEGTVAPGDGTSIKVLGDVTRHATPGADSAAIITAGKLGTLSVTGALNGATVRIGQNISSVVVTGDVSNTLITALAQAVQSKAADVAIARLIFSGNVSTTSILAGYDRSGAAANPDAQIGSLTVAKNWTASNLVAGVAIGSDAGFGNAGDVVASGADNAKIVSRIASIAIKGSVAGSGQAGEHFGFVAQQIRAAKIGTSTFALDALANAQVFDVGPAINSVTIREVAVS